MDTIEGWSIEEIAKRYPESLKVFQTYRIDLCCGGRLTLAEVARKHGLDLKQLVREIEAVALTET